MKTLQLTLDNNTRDIYYFDDVNDAKGVVVIIHGMQEHAKRYAHVAQFLNQNGYYVFTYDQRGHGQAAFDTSTMGVGQNDIFDECVKDACEVCKFVHENLPDLPISVYGHSFGSFVTQKLMQVCDIPTKWILSGTTNGDAALYKLAHIVAKICAIGGKQKQAKLIEKMSFGAYKKHFVDNNWLSRDKNVAIQYENDPLCGTPFPVSFYLSMFAHLKKLNRGIKNIPPNTKVLLIAGDDDPVGSYGKGPSRLHTLYIKRGIDSHLKLYPKCRHELHNELNFIQVLEDVVDFLNLN